MFELLFGRTMQKLVAVSSIFWILTTMDLHWDDARWWSILALLMVVDYLSRLDGERNGIEQVLSMKKSKLLKVKDFMDSVERGNVRSVEELNEILRKEDSKDE